MVDEILLEIPFYVATGLGILLAGKEPVERMHILTLDGNLREEGKGRLLLIPAEGFNLQVGAGLLPVEIIGRECQDLEAPGRVLFLE